MAPGFDRLHALNEELVAKLEEAVGLMEPCHFGWAGFLDEARAAIAKAKT
jgi:hypothetical protein